MTSLKPEPTIAAKLPNVLSTREIMCHMDSIPDDDMYDDYADNFYDVKWVRQDTIRELEKKLLTDINDMYRQIGKPNVWRMSNDEVCDTVEEQISDKIQKVFSEVLKDVR